MAELPRFKISVIKSPRFHFGYAPLRGIDVVRRTRQPWAVEVREIVHGIHYFRILHTFLPDSSVDVGRLSIDRTRYSDRLKKHERKGDPDQLFIFHSLCLRKERLENARIV